MSETKLRLLQPSRGDRQAAPATSRLRLGAVLGDDVADVISSLAERPLRFVLLILVFALGAGGAVVARGVSQTSAEAVASRIAISTLDEVSVRVQTTVTPGSTAAPPSARFPDDAETTITGLRAVTGAGLVWNLSRDGMNIRHLQTSPPPPGIALLGASPAWVRLNAGNIAPAHAEELLAVPTLPDVVLLGRTAAAALDITNSSTGQALWIKDRRYTVAGILRASSRTPALDNAVVLPGPTAEALAGAGAEQVLDVRTDVGASAAVARAAPLALDPRNPTRFRPDAVADLENLRRGVATDLARSATLVSLMVLLAASVTMANTMVMSVMTRTPEIALRRAMGASRARVARLFVTEGAIIGAVGGAAGTSLGVVAIVAVAAAQGWTPVLSIALIPLGIGVGALVGLLAAAYPAVRAASIDPATAIRG